MHVKQERISKGDADNGDRIGEAQQSGPGVGAEIEKVVQGDDEIGCVPPAHRERERREYSLDAGQFAAVRDQLKQHPERQ